MDRLVGRATREYLLRKGYPGCDDGSLPTSPKRFAGGGQYGLEIASAQSPSILRSMLRQLKRYTFRPQRFIETLGIMRMSDADIQEMVKICREEGVGLVLSIGPRATYDIGAAARAPQGARVGYRLRGMESVIYAVEDVKRAAAMGVRGILLYDEGLLHLLNMMRADGELPFDLLFKISVHCGHGNPWSVKLLEAAGAASVNTVGDLSLAMLSSIRQTVDVGIDVHSDMPKASGGYVRTYEIPDLIRVASPVFLKCGAISSPEHAHYPSESDIERRVHQAHLVWQMIQRYYPDAELISENCPLIARPAAVQEPYEQEHQASLIERTMELARCTVTP